MHFNIRDRVDREWRLVGLYGRSSNAYKCFLEKTLCHYTRMKPINSSTLLVCAHIIFPYGLLICYSGVIDPSAYPNDIPSGLKTLESASYSLLCSFYSFIDVFYDVQLFTSLVAMRKRIVVRSICSLCVFAYLTIFSSLRVYEPWNGM